MFRIEGIAGRNAKADEDLPGARESMAPLGGRRRCPNTRLPLPILTVPFAVHTHRDVHTEQETLYTGYQKFQADSRILETPGETGGTPRRRQP
ncbi:MAG TPA: hypothetical protein VGF16_02315 [Bryobacteraceae bacterium]